MSGKHRAQPEMAARKGKNDSRAPVIMLRDEAMGSKTPSQHDRGARERKSARAEILAALEQAHREELERTHLQYAGRVRQIEAARLENEKKLEEARDFHANLAEQYKGEAKQRTVELLEAKDLLLQAREEMATIEGRLAHVESQRDALEIERRTLREALQTLLEQQAQHGEAGVPISQSYPATTKSIGLPAGSASIPLRVGLNCMTADEKTLFEEKLDRAIKTGGIPALETVMEKQVIGRSPQFAALCRLKAASVALANGHVADATRYLTDIQTQQTAINN